MAIIVPILSQFDDRGIKQAIREFERAKTSMDKLKAVGDGFQSVGKSLTRNLTLPLAAASAGIYKTVQAASTLEESISKTDAVFAENASQIRSWAKTAATSFGQSEQQALEAASSYGNLFQAFGLTREQATGMSMDITKLASDLASFNNTSVDDALIALRSGLSGETEPLKRFGVALNDQRLRVKALELGLGEYTGTLPVAVKAQAAYALILQDTALAQGDFERTSGGLANQQRILQAEMSNLTAEFGTAFLPVAKEIVTLIRDRFIPTLQRFSEWFRSLSPDTVEFGVKLAGLLMIFGPMLVVVGKLIVGITNLAGAIKIIGAAIAGNPLGAILTGITLLAVAFITAYKNSETFRVGVNKVLNFIIGAFEFAVNMVISYINMWIGGLNKIIDAAQAVGLNVENVATIGEASFGRLSTAVTVVQQNVRGMSDHAKELAGIATGQVAPALDTTANAAENMGQKTEKAGNKADKAADRLRKLRTAAKEAAEAIVNNLEKSLSDAESKLSAVQDKFNDFKQTIAGNIEGVLDFGKAAESDDFLLGLQDQAAAATTFADKVKQLIQMGLSESAIQNVLDAGFEAGSKIADQLILGGQTVIDQVNTLVASVETVANEVGTFGAETFYQQGVNMAQAMVNAIRATLEAARAELAAIVASLKAMDDEEPSAGKGKGKGKTKRDTKPEKKGQKKSNRRANGGPVSLDIPYLVGERGPEVFIPNTSGFVVPNQQVTNAGGATTINITVNAGMGTNGAQVGAQIVEAIRRYEKQSGQVFVKA